MYYTNLNQMYIQFANLVKELGPRPTLYNYNRGHNSFTFVYQQQLRYRNSTIPINITLSQVFSKE